MRFLGYEEKIVRILEALYQDTMSAVRVDQNLFVRLVSYCGRSLAKMYIVTIVIHRGGDGACVRWELNRCRHKMVIVFPTSALQMTLALWLEAPTVYNSW